MTQKTSIALLFCMVFSSHLMGQSTEELIKEIRKEFQRINSLNELKEIILSNDAFMLETTDTGGSLSGFFEKDQLVKLTSWFGGTNGSVVIDYYITNQQLFFAYERESRFKELKDESGAFIGLDYNDSKIVFEGRYYFNNDQLIKEIEKGKRVSTVVFEEKLFLENCYHFKSKIESKK